MSNLVKLLVASLALLAAVCFADAALPMIEWKSPNTAKAKSKVVQLTTPQIAKQVLEGEGPFVLYYYAEYCPPCQAFNATYDQVSETMGNLKSTKPKSFKSANKMVDIKFLKMDTDKLVLHGDVGYTPRILVGQDLKQLLENPCEIGQADRSSARIKLEIMNCLGLTK